MKYMLTKQFQFFVLWGSAVVFITADGFGEWGSLSVSLKLCEETVGLFGLRVLISWNIPESVAWGTVGWLVTGDLLWTNTSLHQKENHTLLPPAGVQYTFSITAWGNNRLGSQRGY